MYLCVCVYIRTGFPHATQLDMSVLYSGAQDDLIRRVNAKQAACRDVTSVIVQGDSPGLTPLCLSHGEAPRSSGDGSAESGPRPAGGHPYFQILSLWIVHGTH